MERYFDIYLNAGNSVPVVINANQYDASETWIFTLYTDDNQQYVPQNGSIVGLKSDGKTIANAGTVNGDGQVVIAETEQMTACAGINIFELILNGNHGTANFVVLVEPRPGDNATPSDSDLSLMQEAIEAASTVGTVGTLADKVTNLESQMEVWLTEHAGMSNETILWEGRLTGTGSVELSEDASQFDTIAVYTQATSYFEAGTASEAHYYKASDLIANHAVVSVAVASTVSSTAIQSAIITGVVGISGTQNKTFNLIDRKGLYWTGTATDDAGIILGSSDSALITKVVGIRNEQTDAEVVAARVGSDGQKYNNLKARLDAENSALKSAIAQGSGLTNEAKTALLELLQHVAYADDDGQDYYDALESALNPPTNLSYITAVYTQSGTVYPSTSLNSLKSDLVVTAHYSDLTTSTVSSYTLSGTLSEGTSVVTVTYSGKTTTFNVTVTAPSVTGWYYPFNGSLASAGTKDFGFTGTANYATGFDSRQAYLHRVGTEGDSATDVTAIKATGASEYPDMSGDFTMSFWHKSFTDLKGHPVAMSKYLGDTVFTAGPVTASSSAGHGWTIAHGSKSSQKYCGFTWWWYNNQLIIGIQNSTATTGNQLKLTPPSGFSTSTWHHYALTRSGNSMYFFVDGVKQATMTVSGALYSADQITVGSLFKQSADEATNVMAMSNGDVVQDLYISETCKWTNDFDPTAIVYD